MLESRKRLLIARREQILWRDAKLSTRACHTSCHHLSTLNFHPRKTVQPLTCGQNVNARVSPKTLDCVLRIGVCDAMQNHQYMHATRDLIAN